MNKFLATARGEIPAELVIKNARIANVFSGEYESADVAVYQNKIAGVGENYDGVEIFDAQGAVLIPGMIDGHIHIEDTFMIPPAFAETVAQLGTSAVMADPHEISNAMGIAGLEYMFKAGLNLPIDIFWGAPSCVPASEFETPFEELDMMSIKNMFDKNLCQHLGEVMNFPAVINGDPDVWGKITAAGNVPLTGHAPNVTGKNLNAYLSSGISSDHECNDLNEAREKLRKGMWIMIREGASFPNLKILLPLIFENELNAARCMVVSDDITARYLLETGHMDAKMRIMIDAGLNPFTALRMVTLSPAEYFRLYDRGGIAPGKLADFALLDSDEMNASFKVKHVWKNGRKVIKNTNLFTNPLGEIPEFFNNSLKITRIPNEPQIKIKNSSDYIHVIGVTEGTVLTKTLTLKPKLDENNYIVPDFERDIAKIVVLERHRNTGHFSVGFVQGLGIKKGAVGSSVAHDAHNFVVAGADDKSIITALNALASTGGGLVVTEGENIIESLPLQIGGLMRFASPEKISSDLIKIESCAENTGIKIKHPFMVLSFLCLSVIPELRITDKGYIDISRGGLLNLSVK